jgi:diguanylate cyclase (GGDEF) domain
VACALLRGDKFAALIANINDKDLQHVAEKLRSMIETSGLRKHAWERLRTTVSVGGVVVRSGETAAELLKRADDMLSSAKKAGRNRVCC